MEEILRNAAGRGDRALSEFESKRVIATAGIPVTKEIFVKSKQDAFRAAKDIGFPVVVKGCSANLVHKTENALVKLNISDEDELACAYDEIMGGGVDVEGILIQEMVKGEREFVIGLTRDPQFGPCVMFGLGGIFTEVLKDVTFRVAPLTENDALEMISEIQSRKLLDKFRGSPAVNKEILANALIGIGNLALENEQIAEIDVNPVIIREDRPVAVDAVVVLRTDKG
jgi:succinyl-CoA synthetase beta subunit